LLDDYHEVHLASSQHGQAFGAMSTEHSSVLIRQVLAGHTYWVKKRSHERGQPLDGGWSSFSKSIECKVPHEAGTNSSLAVATSRDASAMTSHEFHVIREARGDSPDYLQEHNGANLVGEASFLRNHAHTPTSQLQLFCVDIVKTSIPHVTTAGSGNTMFANYASCQKPQGHGSYGCHKINDADCHWLRLSDSDCHAARTDESWVWSMRYVGKGYNHEKGYALYSFPAASECAAGMSLGEGGCTWKRQNFFRLASGHKGMTEHELKKAFQDVPLSSDSCGGSAWQSSEVGLQEILV